MLRKSVVLLIFMLIHLSCFVQNKSINKVQQFSSKLIITVLDGSVIQSDTFDSAEDVYWMKVGGILQLIHEYEQWYKVSVQVENTESVVTGYVSKSEVTKFNELIHSTNWLNLTNRKYVDSTIMNFSPEFIIELIAKEEFEKQKITAEHSIFVSKDIVKLNGKFELPTKNGKVQLKDSIYLSGGIEYDYEGEIPAFNAYIISETCHECEEITYKLISKKSGEKIGAQMEYLPVYSYKQKQIICLGNLLDPDEDELSANIGGHAELTLYLNDNFEESACYISFPLWKLMDELPEFWGEDGSYYFACSPSFIEPVSQDNYIQFARIKFGGKK